MKARRARAVLFVGVCPVYQMNKYGVGIHSTALENAAAPPRPAPIAKLAGRDTVDRVDLE